MKTCRSLTHLAARLFFTLTLLCISAVVSAETLISSLIPSATSINVGDSLSVSYVITTPGDHFPENGTATFTVRREGVQVTSFTSTSILTTGNIQNGIIQGSEAISGSFNQQAGNYEVQMDIAGLEPGPTAPVAYSDSATAGYQVAAPQTPIVASPASLSLLGGAGETPTTTFAITQGTGPFTVAPLNTDRGSVDVSSPVLNQTVTYGFRIPGAATDQQQFTDTVLVTASDGSQLSIPVTITAQVGGGPPSQGDIDEAMQNISNTQPQSATAAVIGTICPQGIVSERLQQDCDAMVGGALGGATAQDEASLALGQVTSDQAAAPVNASQTSIGAQTRNVNTRISALRSGTALNAFSGSGLSFNVHGKSLPSGQLAQELLDSIGGGAGSSGSSIDFGRLGVFVNGNISFGNKDATDREEGFDFRTTGITLGADYRFTDKMVLGGAVGYVKNDTDLDSNGGKLDTDGYSFSAYGTFYETSGLYIDGIFTYGNNDYDQRRNIHYNIGPTEVNQSASSDFDGDQWSVSFGGGYPISRGAFTFGPTARLEYVKANVDGYDESMSDPTADGGGWATSIGDQEDKSFNLQLGGDVSYAVSQSWGVWIPAAHFEWVHDFENDSRNVVGYFIEDPSQTSFSLKTDNPDTDYFNLSLGFSTQFARGNSAYLLYRRLIGYENLSANSISAGFRMEF